MCGDVGGLDHNSKSPHWILPETLHNIVESPLIWRMLRCFVVYLHFDISIM